MAITKDAASIQRDMRDFANRWRDREAERAESQTFHNELFSVLGFDRKAEGVQFEFKVTMKAGAATGFIDVYAPTFGFLVEQKGSHVNLDKGTKAPEYWEALGKIGGQTRYLVECNFHTFKVTDTTKGARNPDRVQTYTLDQIADNPGLLTPLYVGDSKSPVAVDIAAANLMANLYDTLADELGPHDLSMWLTRILFCLYAEDTGIFPADSFSTLIEATPAVGLDGTLQHLFDVLNTPRHERHERTSENLMGLPYVNGGLFGDRLGTPTLGDAQRDALLAATEYNWVGVNPTIFGAMFQNAMDPSTRRELGEHYTSEDSIMRTLKTLVLDDLEARFDAACRAKSVTALNEFHDYLAGLQVLDPAAGCGNFLLVAYREFRKIERRIYREHLRMGGIPLGTPTTKDALWRRTKREPEVRVKVNHFHGIEIGEFPARIAEVAIYLEQHRQDDGLSADLGMVIDNLPLKDMADMRIENAATLDWTKVVPRGDNVVILGNPPYNGTRTLSPSQKAERDAVWKGTKRGGSLDYVSIWFRKAAEHIKGTAGRAALVSTNSIVQGEQVAPMWGWMKSQGMTIDFAHQTFAWSNEARGMAHVHVVIVGFSDAANDRPKVLFTYPDVKGAPRKSTPKVINSYLVPAADVIVEPRTTPLSAHLSRMMSGTEFKDGAGERPRNASLIMDEDGYREAMADPIAAKYVRPLVGSDELIQGTRRWCLWLVDAAEDDLAASPVIRRRVANTRTYRSTAKKVGTQAAATTSHLPYRQARPGHLANGHYVVLPRVSSERREYVPSAYVSADVITTDAANAAYEATLLDFAVASSRHMRLWAESVAGRLESRIRYGAVTTWNTFALDGVENELRTRIENAARRVLDARGTATLAELYDPAKMPDDLRAAHCALDNLVDEALGLPAESSDVSRLARLFDLYAETVGA